MESVVWRLCVCAQGGCRYNHSARVALKILCVCAQGDCRYNDSARVALIVRQKFGWRKKNSKDSNHANQTS